MSQQEKGAAYRALKDAGVKFDRHYRDYTLKDLQEIAVAEGVPLEAEAPAAPQAARVTVPQPEPPRASQPSAPLARPNPNELPGQRLNVKPEDVPIRTDENGLVWYQEEVRKASYAKPRGRRVLKYMERGVETQTVQAGEYVETFEVAGTGAGRPAEVKITLPSYQVGIYKDPRFPFKIHIYNENRGFDLFEVEAYYGGRELVPAECKRIYVENVLCYDIRTVVRAIQTEFRQLQLAGKA